MKPVYLVDGVRTPIGSFGGSLAHVRADDLAAHVIAKLLDRHPNLDRGAHRRCHARVRQPGRRRQSQRRPRGCVAAAGGEGSAGGAGDAAGAAAVATPDAVAWSAWANCAAVANRSAATGARAFRMASSTAGGTVGELVGPVPHRGPRGHAPAGDLSIGPVIVGFGSG
jgi:acetyl-CoA acetyltransferase